MNNRGKGNIPTINNLKQDDKYELIADPDHTHIKNFIIQQVQNGNSIIRAYMIYQIIMVLLGLFFIVRSVVLLFRGINDPFYFTVSVIIFGFSILVVIHELLHGVALKIIGAPRISYGGDLKKFIFYAQADQFVMGREQFYFVALLPFVLIKVLSFIGIIIFLNFSTVYFFIILMCLHSLFCAGDISLIAFFYQHKSSEVYTYDSKKEGKSYFYKLKDS